MASVGPYSPGTVVDDSAVGTQTWSNPANAKANDGSYASANSTFTTKYSHYLKATNFGFSIPSGATIDGIKVEIDRKRSGYNVYDYVTQLVIGGSVTGSNYADTSTSWPTSDAYASYGGSTDKWGLTPTASEINSSDFGVVLQARLAAFQKQTSQAYVDHFRITVYYTEGSSAHELTAQAITSGTPTIGKPTIAQKHALTSKTIEVGVPTLEQPTIGQKHALTSKTITAGIPTIAKPNIGQKHALTSKAITAGNPLVEKPAIAQIHALTSKDVSAGIPSIDKPTMGQVHALVAKDVVSGVPSVDKPTLASVSGTDNLTAQDIVSGVPVVSKPTLKQIYRRAYIEELPVAVDEDEEEIIMYIMGYML